MLRFIFVIVDTTRNRVLLLISRSYTKIRLEDVSSLTGLSGPELLQGTLCVFNSLHYDHDSYTIC